MKFTELQTIAPVRETGGSTRTNFRATEGWDISSEQGVVTLRKGKGADELLRVLPWNSVAWAIPMRKDKDT